jgi:hypothetical protein
MRLLQRLLLLTWLSLLSLRVLLRPLLQPRLQLLLLRLLLLQWLLLLLSSRLLLLLLLLLLQGPSGGGCKSCTCPLFFSAATCVRASSRRLYRRIR